MKAVVRVGRLGKAAFTGHQQLLAAQQGEEGIAPAGQALGVQAGGDFVQQLARAQAGQ